MKPGLLRKALPHLIAIIVFIVIAVIYCKPALEGQVLQQHDITGWKGAVQQSVEYGKTHGHYPLWTNSLFSGMPTFQIAFESNNFVPGIIHNIMTLWLPQPIQFFFLACICFYILAIILRVNPYVGIIGALGFAYATYNPVIISVGHATKMWTMAYMPVLLGSLLLIYEKKYWLGAALTAMFTSTMISMNHPQIAYYFFIAVAIMTLFFVYQWIKAKEWKHLGLSIVFTGAAAIIGLMTNAVNVLSTYEYQKETIRGGGSELTDTTKAAKTKPTNGLDKSYAMSYSAGVAEPFVMMVPRMFGGSTSYPTLLGGDGYKEMNEDNSKALEALRALPQELGQQIAGSSLLYWGGIQDGGGSPSTSGPPYVGAIICFLAILSFFIVENKHKWWALAAIVFTIMMSWGSNFSSLNDFLFNNLPLYNKFRAPSMALVIPQLLLPVLAILGANAYMQAADKKALWPSFKKGLIATGVVFVILLLLYVSFSYLTKSDSDILKQARSAAQPQLYEAVKSFFDGLKDDRKGLFMGDILRSFGFILIAAITIFLLIKKQVKPILASIILALFVFVDLITIDSKYLNKDNYQDKATNENVFSRTQIDNTILADTTFYRVFNLSGGAYQENVTSYNYNSIGGYHPAKIRIYQDIIEKRFSVEQSALIQTLQTKPDSISAVNTPALNMLNAKYFIYKERDETKSQWKNVNALGNCWFVKNIQVIKSADEEMNAIGMINPGLTAVVQETFKGLLPSSLQQDSTASIQLVKNDNDLITYRSESQTNQFAVFSEVYYSSGWKAFIDGKEAPIVKTNYVLRGLSVPSGKHTIEFKFEPKGYFKGKKLTSVASILLLALVALGFFMEWRNNKTELPSAA